MHTTVGICGLGSINHVYGYERSSHLITLIRMLNSYKHVIIVSFGNACFLLTVEPFKDSMVGVHMSLVIINQPVGLQYELYSITGGQIATLHLGERGGEREREGERGER